MATGPQGSSPLPLFSTVLAQAGTEISEELFAPCVDPMAPLVALSSEDNIQRAFAQLGFSSALD